MTGKALILGANGRFGGAVAEALWNAGWRVRLFDRTKDNLPAAATGADLIVNGWNPTYDRWATELPRLTKAVIDAARASGATILQPANVYVYGDGAPEELGPDTAHDASNPLGRLRIEMEEELRRSGVRVILLRAGDFIDTEASGNWLDRMILPKVRKGTILYPGNPDIPHAWAFLPDLAEIAVRLANRRTELDRMHEVCFPGLTMSGREIAAHAAWIVGKPVTIRPMSWWPIQLSRPFWPMARHLIEMRYLWDMPHAIDPIAFEAEFPDFRSTEAETALAAAIRGIETRPKAPEIPRSSRWSIATFAT